MTKTVMNVNVIQSYLVKMLRTDRVKVRETGNIITIESVEEPSTTNIKSYSCPFLGIAANSNLTVEKFLEWKQEERELEYERDQRLFS
jgi:hypothetical protein